MPACSLRGPNVVSKSRHSPGIYCIRLIVQGTHQGQWRVLKTETLWKMRQLSTCQSLLMFGRYKVFTKKLTLIEKKNLKKWLLKILRKTIQVTYSGGKTFLDTWCICTALYVLQIQVQFILVQSPTFTHMHCPAPLNNSRELMTATHSKPRRRRKIWIDFSY